jgi:hypothetical protein
MGTAKGARVVFQQSLANHSDVAVVEALLADFPGLEELRQTRVLSPGYSGARVSPSTIFTTTLSANGFNFIKQYLL